VSPNALGEVLVGTFSPKSTLITAQKVNDPREKVLLAQIRRG